MVNNRTLDKTAPFDFYLNPGTYEINISMTGYRTLHRVINPPSEVAGTSRRHSLVFFHQPNFDALIECLPTCLASGAQPKYAPVTSGAHLAAKLAQTYLTPPTSETSNLALV